MKSGQSRRRAAASITIASLLGLCTLLGANPQPPPTASPPPGAEALISLDLKGLDILDVLKLLSQKSNLSFIAGKNVTGRVTLFIKDVPLWDAFELIVAANDLAYEMRGNMINVMTGRDYELLYGEKFQDPKAIEPVKLKFAKAAQLATVLNQVKSNVGRIVVDEPSNTLVLLDLPAKVAQMRALLEQLDAPTKTHVWELQYAKAKDLQEKIQETLTPNLGSVKIDERTNKVIVTDVPAVLAKVHGIVRAFDTKTRQVLIEAKIIQVSLSDAKTTGIDWTKVMRGLDATTRGSFDNLGDVLGGAAKGWVLKYSTGGIAPLTALIEAIQTIGKTNIVSSPSIAVTDNQEAKILIGTKEAFVTSTVVTPGGGSPTTTAEQVTFVDVGVHLTVTPMIKADGFVNLKIRPEISSVSRTLKTAQGNEIPIVKTSEAETNVLLKSGTTIIIGGLIEDKFENAQDKIPGLGDLPIIKHAFRDNKDTITKTETVIFLTPYIVAGDEPVLQMAEARDKSPAASQRLAVTPTSFDIVTDGQLPAAYQEAVRRQLRQALQTLAAGRGRQHASAILTFRLRHDGMLLGDPVVEEASDPVFRDLALEALTTAAPFPAIPDETMATEAHFRIPVEYGNP